MYPSYEHPRRSTGASRDPPLEFFLEKRNSGGARIYSGDTHIAGIWDATTKWPRTTRSGVRSKIGNSEVVFTNLQNEIKAVEVMLNGSQQVLSGSTTFPVGLGTDSDLIFFAITLNQVSQDF
jgi:hypothetical protein